MTIFLSINPEFFLFNGSIWWCRLSLSNGLLREKVHKTRLQISDCATQRISNRLTIFFLVVLITFPNSYVRNQAHWFWEYPRVRFNLKTEITLYEKVRSKSYRGPVFVLPKTVLFWPMFYICNLIKLARLSWKLKTFFFIVTKLSKATPCEPTFFRDYSLSIHNYIWYFKSSKFWTSSEAEHFAA